MSKSDQILILEPSTELRFKGPFVDVVTSTLKLTNPIKKRVCFKVKTTAPRRYCVRPNSGVVEGHQSVNVAVMLQPFEYDPNEKNKHKFMVQTLLAPDDDLPLDQVFKDADQTELMDSKLRCVFELPVDAKVDAKIPQNSIDAPMPNVALRESAQEIIGEMPKSSSKASNYELQKAMDEIKRLRADLSDLRKENIQMKEDEIHRQRVPYLGSEEKLPSAGTPSWIIANASQEQQSSYVLLYIVAVVCVFLGYFLGKL